MEEFGIKEIKRESEIKRYLNASLYLYVRGKKKLTKYVVTIIAVCHGYHAQ